MNLPRRSRRFAVREPSVNFADIEPLENDNTVDSEANLLYLEEDVNKFKRTSGDNVMLKEAINAQKNGKETRFLEKCVSGFILNQVVKSWDTQAW